MLLPTIKTPVLKKKPGWKRENSVQHAPAHHIKTRLSGKTRVGKNISI
jgi:hypothetical protein